MEERIQKILAHAGFGSRRACEELILAGRVRVNGVRAILGGKADPARDRISVDGNPLEAPEPLTYVAVYKPRNVLSAAETPDARKTVVDLVELPVRLYPVGRLDFDSEGLILLTNDGDLANTLTHPRYGHEKEYRVLVARRPDDEQLETWRRGVVLEDGYRTQPASVHYLESSGKGAWLRVILREGRKRQIRETGSLLGLPVVRIIRTRIGSLLLGTLRPGEWRRLTAQEVMALKAKSPVPVKKTTRPRTTPQTSYPPRPEAPPAPRPAPKTRLVPQSKIGPKPRIGPPRRAPAGRKPPTSRKP